MKSLVLDIVERVTIATNRIDIWLNRAKIAAALEAGEGSQRPDINPVTLSIEAKLRRAGKGKRLVIANGARLEQVAPVGRWKISDGAMASFRFDRAWKALEPHGAVLASYITPKAIAASSNDRREHVLQRCR
jgi:hypothetical protein